MKLLILSIVLFSGYCLAQTVAPSPLPVPAVPVPASSTLSWLEANWQNVLLLVLAVDAALIPLFPKVGFLVTLKNLLTNITPKT